MIKNDNELGRYLFNVYISSDFIEDYYDQLSKIDKNKTITYYNDLLKSFIKNCANKEEKAMYDEKRKKFEEDRKRKIEEKKSFILNLFNQDSQLAYETLYTLEYQPSEVNKLVKLFKNDGVGGILQWGEGYQEYFGRQKEIKRKEQMEQERDVLKDLCNRFVESGYYSFTDFSHFVKINKLPITDDSEKLRDRLREHNLKGFYDAKLEENKMKFWSSIGFKIKLLKDFIKEDSLNIIDYYLLIGISTKRFNKDFKNFLSYDINMFLLKNKLPDIETSDNCLINTQYEVNGIFISDDIRDKIVEFYLQNHIPLVYLISGFKLYLNGKFNEYLRFDDVNLLVSNLMLDSNFKDISDDELEKILEFIKKNNIPFTLRYTKKILQMYLNNELGEFGFNCGKSL